MQRTRCFIAWHLWTMSLTQPKRTHTRQSKTISKTHLLEVLWIVFGKDWHTVNILSNSTTHSYLSLTTTDKITREFTNASLCNIFRKAHGRNASDLTVPEQRPTLSQVQFIICVACIQREDKISSLTRAMKGSEINIPRGSFGDTQTVQIYSMKLEVDIFVEATEKTYSHAARRHSKPVTWGKTVRVIH